MNPLIAEITDQIQNDIFCQEYNNKFQYRFEIEWSLLFDKLIRSVGTYRMLDIISEISNWLDTERQKKTMTHDEIFSAIYYMFLWFGRTGHVYLNNINIRTKHWITTKYVENAQILNNWNELLQKVHTTITNNGTQFTFRLVFGLIPVLNRRYCTANNSSLLLKT